MRCQHLIVRSAALATIRAPNVELSSPTKFRLIEGRPGFEQECSGSAARRHTEGVQAISTTQPGQLSIESRKPCSLTTAETRLKPRPDPKVVRLLSER